MTAPIDLWFDPRRIFVNGVWGAPASGACLPIINPSDGTGIGAIARGGPDDIDMAVSAARGALSGDWGRMTAAERGRILARIGQKVSEKVEALARIEALDVGKPLKQARADALALARYLEFYGGAADKVMGETIPYLDGYTVYTLREAHGVPEGQISAEGVGYLAPVASNATPEGRAANRRVDAVAVAQ